MAPAQLDRGSWTGTAVPCSPALTGRASRVPVRMLPSRADGGSGAMFPELLPDT